MARKTTTRKRNGQFAKRSTRKRSSSRKAPARRRAATRRAPARRPATRRKKAVAAPRRATRRPKAGVVQQLTGLFSKALAVGAGVAVSHVVNSRVPMLAQPGNVAGRIAASGGVALGLHTGAARIAKVLPFVSAANVKDAAVGAALDGSLRVASATRAGRLLPAQLTARTGSPQGMQRVQNTPARRLTREQYQMSMGLRR